MTRRSAIGFLCLVVACAVAAAAVISLARPERMSVARLTMPDGSVVVAEVADDPDEQRLGLSNRDGLAPDAGMLFLFDAPGDYGFWMKDMRFPIDIVWLRGERVVAVDASVPVKRGAGLESYHAPVPVDAVLELPAGAAARYAAEVGSALIW